MHEPLFVIHSTHRWQTARPWPLTCLLPARTKSTSGTRQTPLSDWRSVGRWLMRSRSQGLSHLRPSHGRSLDRRPWRSRRPHFLKHVICCFLPFEVFFYSTWIFFFILFKLNPNIVPLRKAQWDRGKFFFWQGLPFPFYNVWNTSESNIIILFH